MLSAETPDSAVENVVIRMKCKEKASFSRGAYLVVRNPQKMMPLTQQVAE